MTEEHIKLLRFENINENVAGIHVRSKCDSLRRKLCAEPLSLPLCSGRKYNSLLSQNMHEKIKCSWICVRIIKE